MPRADNTYDLALLSFVILEIDDREEIIRIVSDIQRTLKPGGILVIIGSSEERHNPERHWANRKVDYPENEHRFSGSKVRSLCQISGIEFLDYYWSTSDYQDFIQQSGLQLVQQLHPLAPMDSDYLDEKTHSPYSIFVAKKP
ncbi:methyltransferase domain-containing protein [uncultured Endozoicomonas sp.]|uniref:class I SAM-dependent methyltransferase n=1 Tax=uncultured Endozoicomonas sp. TaxID=432652 RepID=UPI00260FB8C2|nr:methyltransferase domain-containing protein [uncultured Endozoicomonas sp.]